MPTITRRNFVKGVSAATALSVAPVTSIKLAFGSEEKDFTFAYISDAHIQHIKGASFVRNWDQGLKRAVAEANLMSPKPDFCIFGGDLAQLAKPEELDHGAEIMSALKYKTHYVMGEHDYYLDMGAYWENLFGPQHYSWDHKGVHFIVLNSILTHDEWVNKWPTPEQRMLEMAGLDNPNGSPFMVGDAQRQWLKKDLAGLDKKTPVVVFSHSPIQKIFKGWNFWTDDAEQVQALLQPFETVTVLYGHVHQIQYNQIGNIAFQSVMATAWPWPYPRSYALAESHMPVMTVPMNRADPFFERDATGWQSVDLAAGRTSLTFRLPENGQRTVGFNPKTGRPEDLAYQGKKNRVPPQTHY
jgi:Icc protein